MTPEQILQINEQMAKICGFYYFVTNESVYKEYKKETGNTCERFCPNKDWNHLIEVYNACILKWLGLDEDNRLSRGTKEEVIGSLLNNVFWVDPKGLLIEDAYTRLNRFIQLYNELSTPGTQSPDRTIPDSRR